MDEAVINGANLFFAPQFGIDPNTTDGNASRNQWLFGLVNSAPYVSSTLVDAVDVDISELTSLHSSHVPSCRAGSPPR